jgi:hypothetical protein
MEDELYFAIYFALNADRGLVPRCVGMDWGADLAMLPMSRSWDAASFMEADLLARKPLALVLRPLPVKFFMGQA